MNKFKLFPLALAAFAFSACTSEDAVENNPNVEGVKSYVAVNINNVGVGGTRADGDYENGSANENKIEKVRFYFFTQNGDPYKMADETNYKEISVTGNDVNPDNVERITNAVIVINGVKSYPHSMMAVVNPGTIEEGKLGEFMKKADVEKLITSQNFKGQKNDATDFVMTSSVYAQDGKKVWTSDISGHVAQTEDAAKKAPVDIYVERVAAKITSTANLSTDQMFKVGETSTGTAVYARIEGWGIDNEKSDAYLVKSIDSSWSDLGFVWNNPAFNRCYWETSTSALGEHKSWAEYSLKLGENWYTVPNAGVQTTRPLYVVAATLVDKNNKPIELCWYNGVEYLSEDDVKATIASENKKYMKDLGDGNYKSIEKEDLQFVIDATMPYEVKAQLKEGVNVFLKTTEGYTPANELANKALGANNARIHKSGMTYYHTAVKHLGTAGKDGEIGMVRNHFYKVNVTNITGFGTPLYDKDTDFVPVTPKDDENTYLAARINVLSWRVVANNVELGK